MNKAPEGQFSAQDAEFYRLLGACRKRWSIMPVTHADDIDWVPWREERFV